MHACAADGVVLVHNGPSVSQLARFDIQTGATTLIGQPFGDVLVASGDLGAVDGGNDVYYVLGDTEQGATFAGYSLKDGSQTCKVVVPFREVGFVGIAQSLDFDPTTGDVIISGLSAQKATHTYVACCHPSAAARCYSPFNCGCAEGRCARQPSHC